MYRYLYVIGSKELTIEELAALAKTSIPAMRKRIERGWSVEKLLTPKPPPDPRFDKSRRWQRKMRGLGLCDSCGLDKEPERASVGRCLTCADKAKELLRQRKLAAIADGKTLVPIRPQSPEGID